MSDVRLPGPAVLGSLVDVHGGWAWVVVVGNAVAGLWALGAHRLEQLRIPALWWFTAFAEVSVLVQAGLGAWLVAGEEIAAPRLHMFYGFIAVAAVGILYSYRQQLRHRVHLLYGFGGLFVAGLAIRSMVLDR